MNTEEKRNSDSLLVIANKKHPLPAGYEPEDLVRPETDMLNDCMLCFPAAEALEEMFAAAEADGVHLVLGSGYRSEALQKKLYENYAARYGRDEADTFSARPGYSDHQTGLAADISDHDARTYLTEEFEHTPEGQWLIRHAHEYGFIMRYPKGKDAITGYSYEPWHFRYIGVEYATKIYNTDVWYSFEEYFGVEGGGYN
jgi:LAS superfamily LD-carboxypeptidase LdcB